jgi:glycosyltransferase involved in cell wall biosynthesis
MKVIAFLDCAVGAGGGFDQALNALDQMKRLCNEKYEFEVFTTEASNSKFLDQLNIKTTSFSFSKIDRLLEFFSSSPIYRRIQTKFKIITSLEKKLIATGCDLVYFVTPSRVGATFQYLNYITTLWDLCHRDYPEFPEVRQLNSFYFREENFRNSLPPAFLILTDSAQLADLASYRYGVDRERFLPMPYGPSPLVIQNEPNSDLTALSAYGIEPGYFLYPAQFWSHKNHIRILQALVILKENYNWYPKIVFLGKDYGNLAHIKEFVDQNKLIDQVKFPGFVPAAHVKSFYSAAMALVMPTYFGPTNLPPIEAWFFNKPLIYSSHLREQVGEAAILIDPDSEAELAEAMFAVLDQAKQNYLIEAGKKQLQNLVEERYRAEKCLAIVLKKYTNRQKCWK